MPDTALAFAEHDHGRCRTTMLDALARAAKTRGLRLTPARVRVLELLGEAHRAIGAYELLDRLRAEGLGSQPPVVYRALEFLIGAGFAHKIERLNAYVACCQPGERRGPGHGACFLICSGCHKVAEIEDRALQTALAEAAAGRGFAIGRTVLEIEGICPACQAATP
jgi:Fur family zinc uptake transcriptional regulator